MPAPESTGDLTPLADTLLQISGTPVPNELAAASSLAGRLPDKIGPYKVLGVLGTGGMGVVYRAEQDQPRRPVALKIMRPGTVTPECLLRFKLEAEALGRFQHDGIARIYEAGQIGDGDATQPYFAMELIDGLPLTVYADRNRLDISRRVGLMIQLCQSIQHAHYQGVVHRDLKPGNVLVDKEGRPKVLDFGVARVTDSNTPPQPMQTAFGQVVGTVPYMSPEQAEGDSEQVDRRSDVYSLGVICYELLTGKLPHDLRGKTPLAAVRIIREQDPPPLSAVNSVIGRDLNAIVMKALEKEKSRRYQTADAMAADLERYLDGKPIEARHAGVLDKSWKFAKRNKAWVIPASVLLAAIMAGIPLIIWAVLQSQENARLEANRFVQDALMAAQQGKWRDALGSYDKALSTDQYRDSIPVRLNKVRALLAMNDMDRYEREIEALATTPNLGEHEGSVLLLQGDILLGRDDAKAEQLIRQAQEKGLPPSADAFARALLAETTSVAIEHLQKSLSLDSGQPRARAILELLLIVLGRFTEARIELSAHSALFPDDVNGKALRALLAGLERDLPRADVVLNELRDPLGDKKVKALHALVQFLSEFRNPDNPVDPETGIPILTRHLMALAVEFPGLWNLKPGAGPNEVIVAHQDILPSFPLPPLLRKSYVRVLLALANLSSNEVVALLDGEAIEDLNRAVKVHPEGTLLYVRSLVLFARAMFRFGQARKVAIEEAREAAQAAADAPALLPIRQSALLNAALLDGFSYSLDKDPVRRRRIAETLRKMVAAEPNRVPFKPGPAINLATGIEEYNLARLLLDTWQRQAPDNTEALYYRVLVEWRAKSYGTAIEAADILLQQPPGNNKELLKMREEAKKLRKQAQEQWQEHAQRLVPWEPEKR